jgi:glycosyltransferase involved in cell wall biosynthesis
MSKSVLLVGNFLSETVTYGSVGEDLARRLAERGWKVTMTSRYLNRLRRIVDMVLTTWKQRHHYEVAHLDLFSGFAFVWAEAVSVVLRWLHKPYALTLRGGGLVEFAASHPVRVKRMLDSAAAVAAPSRFLLSQMQQYRQDILLLPNPLEIGHYAFTVRATPRPRIIWLRAFHEIYNPTLLPATLVELADYPDFEVLMVGPDKGDGSLDRTREKAVALGVANRIQFTGPVPKRDVSSWLNRGDIFLNTTNIDNTPTSVLEAMACGLCVVSTNVGGIPYLLEDQVDSLLVSPNNPVAMAAAVRRILTEPGLAERLSTNARRKVEQFEWSRILPQWEQMLSRLSENRS